MMIMMQRQAAAAAVLGRRVVLTSTTTTRSAAVRTVEAFHSSYSSSSSAGSSSSSSTLLLHQSLSPSLASFSVLPPPQQRSFSSSNDDDDTTTSSSSGATDALLDLLVRDHAEEVENANNNSGPGSMPPELDELHRLLVSEEDWKIVSDRAMTRMIKTATTGHGNNNRKKLLKVQVSFHCQDMVQVAADDAAEEEPEYPEAEEEDDDEEEEEEAAPVRFTVTVTNPSVGTMVLQCLSENAQLQIQSVAMSSSSSSSTMESGEAQLPASSDYQGPEFTELAQDLQDTFYTFCEETCGINTDLCAFVAMQADFKEQEEYVRFLQEASDLLK